jgi:hypothetical protein
MIIYDNVALSGIGSGTVHTHTHTHTHAQTHTHTYTNINKHTHSRRHTKYFCFGFWYMMIWDSVALSGIASGTVGSCLAGAVCIHAESNDYRMCVCVCVCVCVRVCVCVCVCVCVRALSALA